MSSKALSPALRRARDALATVGYGARFFVRLCGLAIGALRRLRLVIDGH